MNELIKNIDKTKLIKIIIIIAIIILILIGGSLLYYNLFNKKTYTEIENIMITSAQEYTKKNPKELPKEESETINIKVDKLISKEYMKPISEYLKDDTKSCQGSVNITKSDTNYRYVALLDCGKSYKYQTLNEHIKEKEPIVTSSNGLYDINGELIFKGEKLNNYVNFANHTWRIIKITNDKIMLILNDKLEKNIWDNRYNTEKKDNTGINNYSISRIKDTLESLYNSQTLFTNEEKLLLTTFDLPIGKISPTDNDINGDIQKTNILQNQKIGLLTIYDYMNASLDSNCTTTTQPSCTNYNYLIEYEYNFWTITADSTNTYNVYQIDNYNGVYQTKASSNSFIRPTITITNDAIYTKGTGSSTDPYEFK